MMLLNDIASFAAAHIGGVMFYAGIVAVIVSVVVWELKRPK